jgi:hypothetical protein
MNDTRKDLNLSGIYSGDVEPFYSQMLLMLLNSTNLETVYIGGFGQVGWQTF